MILRVCLESNWTNNIAPAFKGGGGEGGSCLRDKRLQEDGDFYSSSERLLMVFLGSLSEQCQSFKKSPP